MKNPASGGVGYGVESEAYPARLSGHARATAANKAPVCCCGLWVRVCMGEGYTQQLRGAQARKPAYYACAHWWAARRSILLNAWTGGTPITVC